ncbi:MAG: aldo/keto reductase, partial [Anaerolineae bacterium]|nr:aldo/keto reductase [Anaerolineae bacterium]
MASGLLTGAMTRERVANMPQDDWRQNNREFQDPRISRNLELVELLRKIGERHQQTPAAVAIAWTLTHPAVTAAIVGARRPDQVDGIIGGGEISLTDEDVQEIEDFLQANP